MSLNTSQLTLEQHATTVALLPSAHNLRGEGCLDLLILRTTASTCLRGILPVRALAGKDDEGHPKDRPPRSLFTCPLECRGELVDSC